jgi:hypothetical protein
MLEMSFPAYLIDFAQSLSSPSAHRWLSWFPITTVTDASNSIYTKPQGKALDIDPLWGKVSCLFTEFTLG